MTTRDAILRDIETAVAALTAANHDYAKAEKDLRQAQGVAERSYDRRAASQRNVDRLKKALAIIEGDD